MEPVQLSTIYKPIQPELLKVEEKLLSIARDGLSRMPLLLEYPLKAGGKRIRPTLTLLAGHFYEYAPERLIPMATSVELFHTATLIHDDIVDKSRLRRGMPTVNFVHGQDVAVLLGDYLFAHSAEMVCSTGIIQVVNLFAQALGIISRGELQQKFSSSESKRGRQHYFEWIGNKTAALFRLAAESGAILSQAPPFAVKALRDYGWNIGLAYQIVDDILDFMGKESEMGKPVGSDLLRGALTLPIILLIERYPRDEELKAALEAKDEDTGAKRVLAMLANSTVIDECYSIAEGFSSQGLQAIQSLPSTPAHHSLQHLAEYMLHRKK